jgi:streptogramin lyase
MVRWTFSALAAILFVTVTAPSSQERPAARTLRLGGTTMQLLAGQGSLWVLTCERGCSGEARRSGGRIVRIDPRTAGVVASATIPRPLTIAVGAGGIYATDFERNTVRRIDLRTLGVTGRLKLRLPFRFSARDNAFLPQTVTVGSRAVWVDSDRGALVGGDPRLRRIVASLRTPPGAAGDTVDGIAAGAGGVWLAESLAGVYRVDERTKRIDARIRVPLAAGKFDATKIFPTDGRILALGVKTSAGVLTQRNVLARIDANHNRVEGITSLPSGQLVATTGEGSLWVARVGQSTVERLDPHTGRVLTRFRAQVGTALAVAGGHLWTSSAGGVVRQVR